MECRGALCARGKVSRTLAVVLHPGGMCAYACKSSSHVVAPRMVSGGSRNSEYVHCQYEPTRCAHSTPPPTLTRSRPSFLPSTTGNCRFGNNCSFQHIDAMLSPEIAKVSTRTAMALRLQCNIDGATLPRDIICAETNQKQTTLFNESTLSFSSLLCHRSQY